MLFRSYGTPYEQVHKNNLEHLLGIVCFPFTPDCRIQVVKIPTGYFNAIFIFPGMKIGDEPRYLDYDQIFNKVAFSKRVFLRSEPEIKYQCSFHYTEIPNVIEKLKQHVCGFFKNEADTHFSY